MLTHQGGFPQLGRDFDWNLVADWEYVTAQTAAILGAPWRTIGIVVGSFVLGSLLGFLACRLMRPLQATVFMAPSPRYAA